MGDVWAVLKLKLEISYSLNLYEIMDTSWDLEPISLYIIFLFKWHFLFSKVHT